MGDTSHGLWVTVDGPGNSTTREYHPAQTFMPGCQPESAPICTNITEMTLTGFADWMVMVETVYYYALPCLILLGIFLGFVNIVVFFRHIHSSIDCYTLGLAIATVLLLCCGVILYLPKYIPYWDFFGYSYGYVISCTEWFWYTTIWLMVIMSLERCLTINATRSKMLCTRIQAGITVVMSYLVCLVSSLPRFWEFEPVAKFDVTTNKTHIVSQKSISTDTPEYNVMYFWYVTTITIFLPLTLMFLLLIILSHGSRKAAAHKRSLSKKHSTGQVLNRKVTDEINISHLLIALIVFYILLTSPYIILRLMYKIFPSVADSGAPLWITLEKIFHLLFYFNYNLHFPLLLIYSWSYRTACCSTCCCCCSNSRPPSPEYAPPPRYNDY